MTPTRGFTLVELAIVLVVLGVLMRAAIVPLSTLDGVRRERAQRDGVRSARDALLAHLVAHGRLPCPVDPGALARSSVPDGGETVGRCAWHVGGLPAPALGWSGPVDAAGAALDPWGRRYVYALSDSDHATLGDRTVPDWTHAAEPAAVGIGELRGSLVLCLDDRAPCPAKRVRANDLVFVVLSHGADATGNGLQRGNRRADANTTVFTLAAPSTVDATRFDDALAWASRSEAVWWLLRAGRLP